MNQENIRIDKWLKVSRLYKHRDEAAKAVDKGMVKFGEESKKIKPSKSIHPGDILIIRKNDRTIKCRILDTTKKTVRKDEAKNLYEILETKLDRIINEANQNKEISLKEYNQMLDFYERKNRKKEKWKKPGRKERNEAKSFKYGDY